MFCVTFLKFLKICFRCKQRLHTVYFEFHLDFSFQTALHIDECHVQIFLGIQSRSDCCKQMGKCRGDDVFIVQFQCADKCFAQLREKVKRSSEECDVSANRFTTSQSADRLVDNCLEYRSSKVFFGSTVVDQRLDICLGKYTTSCGNGIESFIIFRIFIQSGGISL